MFTIFNLLREQVVRCRLCPRLVAYRELAPPRASYKEEVYWRKPVPGFGDPNAWLIILGLAPSAQGGNRTGRIFTGDESGRFLIKSLYQVGLANQPTSETMHDGLKLKGCYLTAAVKCVPLNNKPLREEFQNCSRYFANEFFLLDKTQAVLALGQFAFWNYIVFLKSQGVNMTTQAFLHGKKIEYTGWPALYTSYHPSPQNTYTKKLTEKSFQQLLTQIIKDHK